MQNSLIDAGPLIALFDKNDKYHKNAKTFLKAYSGNLITTWPVITEVMHMLDFHVNVQLDFLQWINMGAIHLFPLEQHHIKRMSSLIKKYYKVPMDLADSSLMVIAEQLDLENVITIDTDYYIYRTFKKKALTNIFREYMN